MVALPERDSWTVEEYLEFENKAELRHEYLNGHIYAIVGASENHNLITSNLHGLLFIQLRQSPCRVFQSETRVQAASKAYFYPDLVVVCGERQYQDKAHMILLNPTLVIEVLSPSTEGFDRGRKLIAYQGIASLQEYLIVAQDEMLVQRYSREAGEKWVHTAYENAEEILTLSPIGSALKLAEIYENVVFEDA